MVDTAEHPAADAERGPTGRRPADLTGVETLRWAWRQLTSMRTALVLLLLLALAAVPGSVIPQRGVDSLKTARWQAQHPDLTPIYDKLQLFSVYTSVWFSAIYILLMISLVGCIIPRLGVYWRGMRRRPPPAPRHLDRLPVHTAYSTREEPGAVVARAARVLRKRGYRVVVSAGAPGGGSTSGAGWVSAERGYLREAGNLLFHVSLLIVLVGFAVGGLFGYKGGVILLVGKDFGNNLTQYDDFVPGSLFDPDSMEDFSFAINDFGVEWIESGRGQGLARKFVSSLTYRESLGAPEKSYDLKVNHPLTIGRTQVFLIGHGYAPVITIRDGNGDVAYSGPTVFLPEDQNFLSFGVVNASAAKPRDIGLEGFFYPTYLKVDGDPVNVMGDDRNPTLSLLAYTGDLSNQQSVYVLDKERAEPILTDQDKPLRIDLQVGQSVTLPDRLGTVSFDGVEQWNRVQISRTPGTRLALGGVLLALLGLLMSLFIRPRRLWVRVSPSASDDPDDQAPAGNGTMVEIAGLDRSGNGDVPAELVAVRALLAATESMEEER
ncbi:MAG: cytochrome c biogenesis protein ResB [Nocardioides sp.]